MRTDYACKRCGTELAEVLGSIVTITGDRFVCDLAHRLVTVQCRSCGQARTFSPPKRVAVVVPKHEEPVAAVNE
jgi:uncharacterized Zn finger protein